VLPQQKVNAIMANWKSTTLPVGSMVKSILEHFCTPDTADILYVTIFPRQFPEFSRFRKFPKYHVFQVFQICGHLKRAISHTLSILKAITIDDKNCKHLL